MSGSGVSGDESPFSLPDGGITPECPAAVCRLGRPSISALTRLLGVTCRREDVGDSLSDLLGPHGAAECLCPVSPWSKCLQKPTDHCRE